jgi:hypothetical protein
VYIEEYLLKEINLLNGSRLLKKNKIVSIVFFWSSYKVIEKEKKMKKHNPNFKLICQNEELKVRQEQEQI